MYKNNLVCKFLSLEAIHKWHQILICRGVCEICLTAPGSLKYVPNDAELSGNNFHKKDFFYKKSHFIIAPILKIHSNSVQEICFVWLCKQTNWRVTMDFQNRAVIKWLFSSKKSFLCKLLPWTSASLETYMRLPGAVENNKTSKFYRIKVWRGDPKSSKRNCHHL